MCNAAISSSPHRHRHRQCSIGGHDPAPPCGCRPRRSQEVANGCVAIRLQLCSPGWIHCANSDVSALCAPFPDAQRFRGGHTRWSASFRWLRIVRDRSRGGASLQKLLNHFSMSNSALWRLRESRYGYQRSTLNFASAHLLSLILSFSSRCHVS